MFEGIEKRRAAPTSLFRNPLGHADAELKPSFRRTGVRRFVQRSDSRLSALLVLAGLSIVIAACGSTPQSSSTSDQTGTKPVRIDAKYLSQAKATVLVNASGYALYMFLPDHQRSVTCNVTCLASWPPVTISPDNHPEGGSGVKQSLLGTVPLPLSSGHEVVTYNRWPLYTYLGDRTTFTANGEGVTSFGGTWWAVTAQGDPAPRPAP